jgi:hypothetical protein
VYVVIVNSINCWVKTKLGRNTSYEKDKQILFLSMYECILLFNIDRFYTEVHFELCFDVKFVF